MRKITINYFLLFLIIVLSSPSILAAASSTVNYNEPNNIIYEISKRTPKDIVSELYAQPETWAIILQNIATGSEPWLRVAVALHPGSDAGASEMLTLSVGEALENSPEKVFKIALPEFKLESVCGGPDVDDIRHDTYERTLQTINKRQRRITSIADASLSETSKLCINFLDLSKDKAKIFYGK